MQLLSGQPEREYPFHVVQYMEADPDGDDGFIPAHNVFYTGFNIHCRVPGLAGSEEGDDEEQSSEEDTTNKEEKNEVEFSKVADNKHSD